jgi:hypothetical protein
MDGRHYKNPPPIPYDLDWDMEREIRLDRIRSRMCTRPDCERPAYRGWTTCKRHYTGGRGLTKAEAALAEGDGK